jgi:hypothetical protein
MPMGRRRNPIGVRGRPFQWTPLFDVASQSAAAALILAKKIAGQLFVTGLCLRCRWCTARGSAGWTRCTNVHSNDSENKTSINLFKEERVPPKNTAPHRPKFLWPSDPPSCDPDRSEPILSAPASVARSYLPPPSSLLLSLLSGFCYGVGPSNIYMASAFPSRGFGFCFSFLYSLLAPSLSPDLSRCSPKTATGASRAARHGPPPPPPASRAALLLILRPGVPARQAPPAHLAGRWRDATALPACGTAPRADASGGCPKP